MTAITNVSGVAIEDGTPFEITMDGDNIDYIDYTVGSDVFRETYTYSGSVLVSVTIPTLQVLP